MTDVGGNIAATEKEAVGYVRGIEVGSEVGEASDGGGGIGGENREEGVEVGFVGAVGSVSC